MQAGGGGEATGPIIIPPSTSKTTFFGREFNEWAGSIALKHAPSGLFAISNFSTSKSDDSNVIGFYTGDRAPDMSAWDVQAGIQKKWFAPGETAFWGGYAQVNDGWAPAATAMAAIWVSIPADSILEPGTFVNIGVPVEITGSEVDRWFLALDQSFEISSLPSLRRLPALERRPRFCYARHRGFASRQAQERSRNRSTISTCSTPAGASTSNPGPPLRTPLRPPFGAVFFYFCATSPEASSNLWLCSHRHWQTLQILQV